MPTNILGNEIPKKSVARFTARDGRTIIEDSNGKVYSFEPSCAGNKRLREVHTGFHSGMFLQPALSAQVGDPIQERLAGDFPFKELQEHVLLCRRAYTVLRTFLRSLDPELDVSKRRRSARRAIRMFEDDTVVALIEPALMQTPLPQDWDTTTGPRRGRAGEILQAMIKKWR